MLSILYCDKCIANSVCDEMKKCAKAEKINRPLHYQGKFEVIDILEDKLGDEGYEGFCIGNVMKYVMRYKGKGGVEDLEKAQRYLGYVIDKLKKDS